MKTNPDAFRFQLRQFGATAFSQLVAPGKTGRVARRSAFTLIEMLVVIAIIGLLAALAAPVLHNFRPNYTASVTQQPSQILNPNPDNPDGSNKVLFNFISSSNLPSEWVFYSTFGDASIVSSTVTAPEPSSMLLLGSGLLALCGGLRRRSKNASAA